MKSVQMEMQKGADALFARLSREIANRVSIDGDLNTRLSHLAQAVTGLPGVTGVLAVGCDQEGQPLRLCSADLSMRKKGGPLAGLGDICSIVRENEGWGSISLDYFDAPGAGVIRTRLVESDGSPVGMVCVGFQLEAPVGSLLEALEKWVPHFGWAILVDNHFDKARLYEQLRGLEIDELGRKGPPDPEIIAERLKGVYHADAVTILFREQKKLYPSATTEPEISAEELASEQEDLTQYVFRTSEGLRLRNAYDPEEVRIRTQGACGGEPLAYREMNARKDAPVRYLAVPMVSDDRVRGVIRILRRGDAVPFTRVEEETLQHFAHLLGLAMHSAWQLFLARNIIDPGMGAICMTRSEAEAGQMVPRVVYADAGCRVLFNIDKETLDGLDARGLYEEGEYDIIKAKLLSALRRGRKVCGPYRTRGRRFNKLKDVTRTLDISYRLVASPFARQAAYYTIAVIRDVTKDQVKAEQHSRLVNLLDMKGLAYFRSDIDDMTVETSPTESRLTQYDQGDLVGMGRVRLWVDPKARPRILAEIKKAGGELVKSMQRIKRKDGSTFLAEAAVHLLTDADGKPMGYEGLYEDVTERVKLQGFLDAETDKVLENHQLYLRLQQNQSLNFLFLTSLAHQLRSPLGALVEQLRNFQEGVSDASRFSSRLRYAIGQARVSALLVANLTHMDMVLRGEPFRFLPVRLAKLAIETKLDFLHLCKQKNLALTVDDGSIDRYVKAWGHRDLMRQVFVNLVDNAIKYSFPGTEIVVRGCHDDKGRYLEVSNQGLPIPEVDRGLVFRRGVRLGGAEALVPAGTGLGLWLVRKILAAHYATIDCSSLRGKSGKRVAFQIFFPSRVEVREDVKANK